MYIKIYCNYTSFLFLIIIIFLKYMHHNSFLQNNQYSTISKENKCIKKEKRESERENENIKNKNKKNK